MEEGLALTIERAATARGEAPGRARPELVEAVAAVAHASLEARLAAVESWIAWRSGDRDPTRDLTRRALDQLAGGVSPDGALHCRALLIASAPERHSAAEIAALARAAEAASRPDVTLDALSLLAAAGVLPPAQRATLRRRVAQVPPDQQRVRRGLCSAAEAGQRAGAETDDDGAAWWSGYISGRRSTGRGS